jgi:non-ribosomal peptide synthetase component F
MQNLTDNLEHNNHVLDSSTPSSRDALYATFTSGTTGTPKGIVIEHQAFVTSAMGQMDKLNITNTTRALQYSSYAFDVAIGDILVTLLAGGCVCIPSDIERKDLTALPNAVAQLGANWAYLTFTVAKLLKPEDYPSLQTVLIGGEQVFEKDVQSWHNHCKIHFSYGPAEASVHCASNSGVTPTTNGCNFGRPYNCRMWIVDQYNDQNLAPIGSVGELVIEGHLLARECELITPNLRTLLTEQQT